MVYLEVLVADSSYHGTDALTYTYDRHISVGSIVFVPLRTKIVPGIVVRTSTKQPIFKTKSIAITPLLPPLPSELLDLLNWMRTYYPAPLGTIVQQFLPRELPKKIVEPIKIKSLGFPTLPRLTSDQAQALAAIQPKGMHILHGATGTGKTRVYLELAMRVVKQGRSAIILTPEIGLTSQLEETFSHVFGTRVVILHSQLTEVTRRRLWVTILTSTEPLIIIGPRSALFSPVQNVGLVVVDEAHETAYKQDKSPYYHATHVTGRLANLYGAPLILGSATPLVTDYYHAEQKNLPIIRMSQTATDIDAMDTNVQIVDLKDREQFTKKSHLSDKLIQEVKETLLRNEQVLLFLNRRGTARVIMCDECGWQALCPHCDIPLIYHSDSHSIRCHSCNYYANPPTNCPDCHNTSVIFKTVGTKAIFDEAQKLFPHAKIQRFDTDNTKEERFEQHYQAIKDGDIDILVGTQTLAKGLDLPKLSLVGVIAADTSLYIPDFSSQERTHQLLSQVIGRVGRGHRAGTVVIQTYNPGSPILHSILAKDWLSFYERERSERQQFLFPPFCYMLKVWCRRATQKSAQSAAQTLSKKLRSLGLHIIIEGPAPAFREKVQSQYEWQLIIKSKQRSELIKVIEQLPANWHHDIDPMNLL